MQFQFEAGKDYDARPKLPTLKQWLSELGRKRLANQYVVLTIWTPGKWKNYTFETGFFKIRINVDSELGQALDQIWEEAELSHPALAIVVDPSRNGNFTIKTLEKEKAKWDRIGSNGWSVTIE